MRNLIIGSIIVMVSLIGCVAVPYGDYGYGSYYGGWGPRWIPGYQRWVCEGPPSAVALVTTPAKPEPAQVQIQAEKKSKSIKPKTAKPVAKPKKEHSASPNTRCRCYWTWEPAHYE